MTMGRVSYQQQFLAMTNLELKGHILIMLKYIPLYGKDHKDANRLIDEVLVIGK